MSSTKATSSPSKKQNMAGPKITSTDSKQSSTKGMHRRSRTGCFTCRLRRKKCDEGRNSCKQCLNLGVACWYKRPHWWSNAERRRAEKETIKTTIKHTSLQKKAAQQGTMATTNTPPSLSHSLRTSRELSLESQLSATDFNFNHYTTQDLFSSSIMAPPQFVPTMPYMAEFSSPYEVGIKTECETLVNDVVTRRNSTVSSFSAYQVPVLPGHGFDDPTWVQTEVHESQRESFVDDSFFDTQLWELPHAPFSPQHNATIEVEENDQYLVNHFVDFVMPLIFPILEAHQQGAAQRDILLPALENNVTYRHCCLSAAALHLKNTQPGLVNEITINSDIQRHNSRAIYRLFQAHGNAEYDDSQTLEATLAMIIFDCFIGRHDGELASLPWHVHFDPAKELITNRLNLVDKMRSASMYGQQAPFNMTLASWIDILGATMNGNVPAFADLYREQNMANASAGLTELMGCEDKIMFLISEIACLEAKYMRGEVDELVLCAYIKILGDSISLIESTSTPPESVFAPTGAIRPKQLTKNITHIFRLAARIYLCSLVPEFDRSSQNVVNLVAQLSAAMDYIPDGPAGYDRALVWPLLIAGSVSLADSPFRKMFAHRSARMGDAARFGNFSRAAELLRTLWQTNDLGFARGERRGIHWRDVMAQNGWDFLLI